MTTVEKQMVSNAVNLFATMFAEYMRLTQDNQQQVQQMCKRLTTNYMASGISIDQAHELIHNYLIK